MFLNKSRGAEKFLRYAALALLCAVFLFPLVWMFSYSLRATNLPPPTRVEFFAPPLAFENYARLGAYMNLAQLTVNSLRIVVLAVPLTVLFASLAGFAIAQLPARWRSFLLTLCVALMLVPAVATWIPRFLLFTELGWTDTILPLLAPAVMGASPFFVILFVLAFRRVPTDVYESAYLDGANALRIWWSVAMPLAHPATIAVATLAAVFYWSNYIDPFLYLRTEENYTLPYGVQLLEMAQENNFPLLMAASVLVVAPVLVLFLIAQRYFLQGKISERWLG
jgi:multiple sugar transport system permease protein